MAKAELDRQRARYTQRIVGTIRANDENDFNGRLASAADAYTARAAAAAHADDAEELAVVTARHALAIGSRTDLSAEQKAKAHSGFKAGVAAQAELGRLDGIIKDKGLEPADQYAADFKAGRAGGGKLAEAERDPIARLLNARLDDVRAGQRQAEAEKAAKAKSESERRLAAAEEAIAKGGYGRHELERDLQTNRFADLPDAPAWLSKAIDRQRQERAEKAEARGRGAEAVAAGRRLDGSDPGHVADIEAWYAGVRSGDFTHDMAQAAYAVRQSGILPPTARQEMIDAVIYGTPERQAAAARAVATAGRTDPGSIDALPLDVRTRADVFDRFVSQGHAPKDAAAMVKELLGNPAAPGVRSGVPEGVLTPAADTAEEEPPSAKPATEARPVGHPMAAPGTPAPWRKILEVMEGAEAEALQDLVELIPEDPDSAADELKQALVELGLSFLPGVGNLLSAAQTYRAIVAAYKALKDDNLAKALEHGGDAAINAIGTIPGFGNLAKAGVRGVEATQAMVKVLRGKKAIAATQATTRVGSSVADTAFAHWVRNLFGGTTRAVGKTEKVGSLRPEVGTFLEAKGIKVQTDGIEAIDYKIRRMERKGKPSEKHAPRDVIESIPEVLRNPDEILWDGEALLYVRHLKGNNIVKNINPTDDRNRVKFVVNVNCRAKVQSDDGKIERLGNWVWSATRIPAHNLDVLERVWP